MRQWEVGWPAAALVLGVLCGAVPPASGLQATVAGQVVELSGHLEVREVVEANGSTPDDRSFQQVWLGVRCSPTGTVSIEATVAGRNGGPATESDRSGAHSFDDVFQSVAPSVEVEEAFLDVHLADADVRIGKQKISWGKLDRFQPTDVLNSERHGDLFMLEEDERKIGVPAVQVSYFVPTRRWLPEEGRLTGVWIPYYIPFRLSRAGERWFPPAAVPPDTFVVPAETFSLPDGSGNPAFEVPVGFEARNVASPGFRAEHFGYAVRFSGFSRGVDYAVCYYHGFDKRPAFRLAARLAAEAVAEPAATPLGLAITAQTELTPVFRVIDSWGADAAYVRGSFTFRMEAAYFSGRPFNRDLRFLVEDQQALAPQIRDAMPELREGKAVSIDLGVSFVERDAIEWGVGVDYSIAGYLLLLQLNQTDVLDNDVDLLIEDVDTQLLANVRKKFWRDDLAVQLIGLYGIESSYAMLLPRVTYRPWERLELQVGYLSIAGRRSSLVGQYKRNDQGFMRLRYLF